MRKYKRIKILAKRFVCLAIILSLISCGKIHNKYSKNEIIKQIDIAFKKYNVDAKVRLVGKTLYVYVPLESLIITPKKPKSNFVKYFAETVDGVYKNREFNFNYYIKELPERHKEFQKIELDKTAFKTMQKVSYLLANKLVLANADIDFLVEIYADTKIGFWISYTNFINDLKKGYCELYSGVHFSMESSKRVVQDFNQSADIIADKNGASITYRDLSMGEFIAKQIAQRIRQQFQKDVPLRKTTQEVIKGIIKDTLRAYKFNDFSSIQIKDLLDNKTATFDSDNLK